MAGQYDTFLNLATADSVVEAVIRCWESVGSERVAAYLHEQGIDPAGVAMAVVVQKLVPAEVAGVLFTTNPRTGSPNEMLDRGLVGIGRMRRLRRSATGHCPRRGRAVRSVGLHGG